MAPHTRSVPTNQKNRLRRKRASCLRRSGIHSTAHQSIQICCVQVNIFLQSVYMRAPLMRSTPRPSFNPLHCQQMRPSSALLAGHSFVTIYAHLLTRNVNALNCVPRCTLSALIYAIMGRSYAGNRPRQPDEVLHKTKAIACILRESLQCTAFMRVCRAS